MHFQPSSYLCISCRFAEVGPVYETDDPHEFMQHMENLMALGGGDEPEMCLSAIQVNFNTASPVIGREHTCTS